MTHSEYCNSRRCICDSPKLCEASFNAALKSKEVRSHSAQQLKPKMPLLDEVLNTIGDKGSNITCQWNFNAGVRECYEYISRHFGH